MAVSQSTSSIGHLQSQQIRDMHLGDNHYTLNFNGIPAHEILHQAFKNLNLQIAPDTLVKESLLNPRKEREIEESLGLLFECIRQGFVEAEKAEQKDVILFIGNTGAGKSTTINYLCGCTMELKTYRELGLIGLGQAIIAKPEIMPIGHDTRESKTFLPQIEHDSGNTYMDCPGFLDSRGPEINIANAVNVKNSIKKAQTVRVVILIDYYTLKARKGAGLTEMLQITYSLFGSEKSVLDAKESLFIGITGAFGTGTTLQDLREWVAQGSPTLQQLQDRIFTYDPVERPIEGAWTRQDFLKQLKTLKPVPNHTRIFSTVLTQSDEDKLLKISEQIGHKIHEAIFSQKYSAASAHYLRLKTLSLIDHPTIDRLLGVQDQEIENHIHTHLDQFRAHCWREQFSEADALLKTLQVALAHFQHLERVIHMDDLRQHYDACIQQREDKKQLKNLRKILEDQQKEIVALRKTLEETHQKIVQSVENKIQGLQTEFKTRLHHKEEELQVTRILQPEIEKKIEEEKRQLEAEYAQKLAQAKEEKKNLEQEHQRVFEIQQKEFKEKETQLQQEIAALKAKTSQKLPAGAFGKADWEKYFGLNVGEEPALPKDIDKIMGNTCPFFSGWFSKTKVQETHLLVLIPETIGGKPLTLQLLGEIVQKPAQGPAAKYYKDSYFASYENTPAPASHWALLTRDVIPGSRKKRYDAQQALVQEKPGYQVPTLLDATTAIFMEHVCRGTRLYSDNPWTFTRCQEKNGSYPMVVGGFSAGGLCVDYLVDEHEYSGVNALRKF